MKFIVLFAGILAPVPILAGESGGSAESKINRGKTQYAACAVCHQSGQREATGPELVGVIGRKAGTLPGFRFSRALRRAGIVWSEETLREFLADPQATVPGNAMPFAGVPDAAARDDLIAYLASLK